jgi:hypothetical protein
VATNGELLRARIAELIARWRLSAGDSNDDPYDPAATYNLALEVCADELSDLLDAASKCGATDGDYPAWKRG